MRSFKRGLPLFGLLLAAIAVSAAGCGNNETAGELATSSSERSPQEAQTQAVATRQPAAAADEVVDLDWFSVDDLPGEDTQKRVEINVAPPVEDRSGGAGKGRGAPPRKAGFLFGTRGGGSRYSGTKQSERTLAAALDWLARHQAADGSWSLEGYVKQCRDETCSVARPPGQYAGDVAGTALALLPFLRNGITHRRKSDFRSNVQNGLAWLLKQQKPDGNLRGGRDMYAHALATDALAEVFLQTNDKKLALPLQKAIDFIEGAQNKDDGGWGLAPGKPGDTFVSAWQVDAMQLARIFTDREVAPECLDGAEKFLKVVTAGDRGDRFRQYPGGPAGSPAVTAAGLLCRQYFAARRNDPQLIAGVESLMSNLPTTAKNGQQDVYYWYFGSRVLHNMRGPDWDTWNRNVRCVLMETQVKEGCAEGSWNPEAHEKSPPQAPAGRLAATSLSALCLPARFPGMPLFQMEHSEKSADSPL
jgi:hypothetical protein